MKKIFKIINTMSDIRAVINHLRYIENMRHPKIVKTPNSANKCEDSLRIFISFLGQMDLRLLEDKSLLSQPLADSIKINRTLRRHINGLRNSKLITADQHLDLIKKIDDIHTQLIAQQK